jgi:hypothetical protein
MSALHEALRQVEVEVRGSRGGRPARSRAAQPSVPEPSHLTQGVVAARGLLRELDSPALQREWRRLDARLGSQAFTIVILGDARRGKSTVIHHLLEDQVLPVQTAAAETRFPVRITAGPERLTEAVWPSGEKAQLPVTPETWHQLASGEPPELVRVELPHPWLRATSAQIVEMPSPTASQGEDRPRCLDALAIADAALLVVSATAALGLAERRLFERHVLDTRVPRKAVVLTHLDAVPAAERPELLDFVLRTSARWGDDVLLATLDTHTRIPSRDPRYLDIGALRDRLQEWAGDEVERQRLVNRQVGHRLLGFLDRVAEVQVAEREALDLSAEEERRRLDLERRRLEERSADCKAVLAELWRRRDERLLAVEITLEGCREELSRNLGFSLQQDADLRRWWNEKLPHHWRRELEALAGQLERRLRPEIDADIRWLATEVERHLATKPAVQEAVAGQFEPPSGSRGPSDREDLPRLRLRAWLVRAGSVSLAVLGVALTPALGVYALLSAAPGLVAEPAMFLDVRRKREALLRDLDREIAAELRRLADAVRSRTEDMYRALEESVEAELQSWRRSRLAARQDEGAQNPTRSRDLAARIDRVRQWRARLAEFLDQSDDEEASR